MICLLHLRDRRPMTKLNLFVVIALCCCLLALNSCKTGSANASLATNSSFSFNGHSYNNLSVFTTGTTPYIVNATPISLTGTSLTMSFTRGNPSIGDYSVTPTESKSCIINYSTIIDSTVVSYVSVLGTVNVAENERKRRATFTNVTMVSATNPADTKVVSGTILF